MSVASKLSRSNSLMMMMMMMIRPLWFDTEAVCVKRLAIKQTIETLYRYALNPKLQTMDASYRHMLGSEPRRASPTPGKQRPCAPAYRSQPHHTPSLGPMRACTDSAPLKRL